MPTIRKNRGAAPRSKSKGKSKAAAVDKAMKAEMRHSIELVLPDGSRRKIGPYASRRAATIDAKSLMIQSARAIEAATGERPKITTARSTKHRDQRKRTSPSSKRLKYKRVARDAGYGIAGEGLAMVKNGKRRKKSKTKRRNGLVRGTTISKNPRRRNSKYPTASSMRAPKTWPGMLKGRPNPVTGRKANRKRRKGGRR